MKRSSFFRSRSVRFAALVSMACLSMAFTIPGCPDVDAMNAKMNELDKRTAQSQKQTSELVEQIRVLNDEHNTMKQLVSQISTTVLEQKEGMEKLESSMASRRAAPAPAAKKAPQKRRR